jgi:hypothetical protein
MLSADKPLKNARLATQPQLLRGPSALLRKRSRALAQ